MNNKKFKQTTFDREFSANPQCVLEIPWLGKFIQPEPKYLAKRAFIKHPYHPDIYQVMIIQGKNNFPISWLNTQDYCEYSLYLEKIKGIKVKPTQAMESGTTNHAVLENKFKEEAIPSTMQEMLELSKTEEILSREIYIESAPHGIRGFIDEIWMTPKAIIIIDDKPGDKAYPSHINQVYGYCLAFKDSYRDNRPIIGALRQTTTSKFFWQQNFDEKAEEHIENLVQRVHSLMDQGGFIATDNPKKCSSCRFEPHCDEKK